MQVTKENGIIIIELESAKKKMRCSKLTYRKRIEPLVELNNHLNDILSYIVSNIEYLKIKNNEK